MTLVKRRVRATNSETSPWYIESTNTAPATAISGIFVTAVKLIGKLLGRLPIVPDVDRGDIPKAFGR